MASTAHIFSLAGQSLKLTEAADIEPKLVDLPVAGSTIHTVVLSGNTLGPNACEYLAEKLRKQFELHTAVLSDIFTGRLISEIPLALTSLCSSLSSLPALTHVDLSDNAFGGRSALPLVTLISDCKTLREFKLQNNGLGVTGGQIVAQAFLDMAKTCRSKGITPSIRKITIGRNRLENDSCPLFSQAFALLGTLEEVRMPQNGIRKQGIQLLMQGLAECPNLKVLDLEDNTCSFAGSRAISRALPGWTKISELNLSDCLLTRRGSTLVVSALAQGKNTELKELKIQYAAITAELVKTLAAAVKKSMPLLKKVEINGNRCDEEDEALTDLRDAMGEDADLGELDEMDEEE